MKLRFSLLKTTYEWLLDEGLTPYFLVDTTDSRVKVPQQYVESGQIVLDASMEAVDEMRFDEVGVSFEANFDGEVTQVFFPIDSIQALYAEETDQGFFMTDDPGISLIHEAPIHDSDLPEWESKQKPMPSESPSPSAPAARSHLKLVK